jgi:tyrosyl-tRNA synthetase
MSVQTQIKNLLEKGVSRVIDRENLEKRLASGKPLRVKFGIDPTGTIVHIGHAVPIMKLRQFQQMGHHVTILIGDATAQVGDTSDKEAERPMLKREETRKNAETWVSKFNKILDVSKVEIYYNSEGLDKVNFCGVGELAKHFSVAEMLDRDNFSKRYKAGIRISLQEFLYPIMQGYDSVVLKTDVELGGNDQYFNLLAGRKLQEAFGQPKQDIMTFDLLLGPDGKKMSKTGGNCIPVDMEPNAMFVKLMEVKDDLILDYFRLATVLTLEEIEPYAKRLSSGENPRTVKLDLARTIVSFYHDDAAAEAGRAYFEKVLSEGMAPSEDQMEKAVIETSADGTVGIIALLKTIGFAATTGEAKTAITGGGVRIRGEKITDDRAFVALSKDSGTAVQVGKKKFKLVFSK